MSRYSTFLFTQPHFLKNLSISQKRRYFPTIMWQQTARSAESSISCFTKCLSFCYVQRLWSCRSTRHANTFCLKSIFPLGLGQQLKANCSGWVQTSTKWLSRLVSNTFPWQPCQYWSMFPHLGSGLNTFNMLCKMEAKKTKWNSQFETAGSHCVMA